MKYYIQEYDEEKHRYNAGSKARNDADHIFGMTGAEALPMVIPYARKREQAGSIQGMYYHFAAEKAWNKTLAEIKTGDTVLFQFPVKAHTIRLGKVLGRLKRRGIRTIALLHDLEYLRNAQYEKIDKKSSLRMTMEEISALKVFDWVIAHNERMKQWLTDEMGISGERIVTLEIFDYLIPEYMQTGKVPDPTAINIAGNLDPDKSGYIYHLPDDVRFELYGAGWKGTETKNIRYHGKFLPDELPGKLDGGFGLVWDGPETKTCSGIHGGYLRYNNPHKTSLYLAAGIPVIIWEEAAMADFIRREGCGITIKNLDGLKETLDKVTDAAYREMTNRAKEIGVRLREGYYTRKALEKSSSDLQSFHSMA